jgi:hypothetical protein
VSLSRSSQIFDRVLDSPQRPLGWCEPEKVVALGGFSSFGLTRLVWRNPLLPGGGDSGLPAAAGTGRADEPVSGEVRSRQTDARPFCRALRLGFAGLGFLGFLVAKQPLPKGGLRLGPSGLPESVLMPP